MEASIGIHWFHISTQGDYYGLLQTHNENIEASFNQIIK